MTKGQGEKVFDALALAALPEHALVCHLAARLVRDRRAVELEDARAVVRSLFPEHGTLERLAILLVEECNRQRPLRNARRAISLAEELRNRPIHVRLRDPRKRRAAKEQFAQSQFGDYVNSAFSDDVLALLELMKHDHRIYNVVWMDAGVRPTICALVSVRVEGEKAQWSETFLLYKVPATGVVRSVEVGPGIATVRDAWSYQVPKELVSLKKQGWSFTTDFENQSLVATGPGGSRVIPWQGSASHDEPESDA